MSIKFDDIIADLSDVFQGDISKEDVVTQLVREVRTFRLLVNVLEMMISNEEKSGISEDLRIVKSTLDSHTKRI